MRTPPNEFAVWLGQAMRERGISGVTLARRVNEQLADGHFAASNISHYLSGRSRPRPAIQDAVERALASSGSPGEQPLTKPAGRFTSAMVQDTTVPPLHVEDLGDGRARLVINRHLPWPDVLKVLELFKLGDSSGSSGSDAPRRDDYTPR
jgi:hypothetical protein